MGSTPSRSRLGWRLPEDRILNEHFQNLEVIGEGSQGAVVRAAPRKGGGAAVALKLVSRQRLTRPPEHKEVKNKVRKEISDDGRLCHPLIVGFQQAFLSEHYLVMVMECPRVPVRHGRELWSLEHFLVQCRDGLGEDIARFYFQQLVVALDYCHRKQVANRDLKLDNCLLHDEEGTSSSCLPLLKLCDWGLSKTNCPEESAAGSVIGTPGYCASEVVTQGWRKCPYDPYLVDIYSCGVILYKLLCGLDSWPDRDPVEEKRVYSTGLEEYYNYHLQKQKDNFHLRPELEENISGGCQDLLVRMLQPDPRHRCDMKYILGHTWFTTNLNDESRNLNDKLLNSERLNSIESCAPSGSQVEALLNLAAATVNSDLEHAHDNPGQVAGPPFLDA